MINISLLERSIPVAPIKIAALKSCAQLASQVDSHLVQFRKELYSHNRSGLNFRGILRRAFSSTVTVHALAPEKPKALSVNLSGERICLLW